MSMVQLGLHCLCCNKCDFCTIKDNYITTPDAIIREIDKAILNIKYIAEQSENWMNKYSDGISILGGEIYFYKNDIYKTKILELIDTILEYILIPNKNNPKCKFSTVTNGMYDPEWLLFPVIDKIIAAVGTIHVDVNFSYDFKYRFHDEESRLKTINCINEFHKKYNYITGVQMILTQDVIDKYLNGWRTSDLVNAEFPGNRLAFLYPHPIHRGNNYAGEKNLPGFNFTRRSFLQFIKLLKFQEPDVFESFLYSTRNSAIFKYTMMVEKDTENQEFQVPILSEGKEIINKLCPNHHSELYKCYSDCDNCILCDVESVM